jgi:hypothetical protein
MAKSAAERMRVYRKRLKADGLRPARVLLPDLKSRRFREELRRQSLLLTRSRSSRRELEAVEAMQSNALDPWVE